MRLKINPPVIELFPNQRQVFTAEAEPPPAMWWGVTDSGDIQSDFSLQVDAAGSQVTGSGAHVLASGIGFIEFTIDNQFRPTSTNLFVINTFLNDTAGFLYFYSPRINSTTVKVIDETASEIYTETYSTVSGDVYRVELSAAGFRLFRNGVLKHSRVNLGTTTVYPAIYQCFIAEPVATDPARIPQPKLIGDWKLGAPIPFNVGAPVTWTAPSHGSLTTTGPNLTTEYFGGTTPGTYTLTGAIEAAADAGGVQRATATITIPPLKHLGPGEVTLQPGEKARFKVNYPESLITWSVVFGGGSFTQGEFTASATAGTSVVRATASVNSQAVDIIVNVPALITNANGYTAAKASEEIDFGINASLFPVYLGAGSLGEGTGNITPGLPLKLQLNDIILLFTETANEAVSTPSGLSTVADSPQGTGTGGDAAATRLTAFWDRMTATETAPTITDPGDHAVGRILAFRGCVDTGNPWDVTSGDVAAAATTSVSIPGDTTTVVNTLVVLAVSNGTDTATAQTSGYTNTDLANLTERVDNNSTQGNGGGFAVATGEKATASAYGATTATLATSSTQGRMSIALKPALITWTASIGSINSTTGLWTAPSLAGQTAIITATNGTFVVTLEIDVLQVFPLNLSAPLRWDLRKTVLVSRAEDRTRTSRVKDKDGEPFQAWEASIVNLEIDEVETLDAFWQAHHPGVPFIFENTLHTPTVRKVFFFDSDIAYEADSSCAVSASFRMIEG